MCARSAFDSWTACVQCVAATPAGVVSRVLLLFASMLPSKTSDFADKDVRHQPFDCLDMLLTLMCLLLFLGGKTVRVTKFEYT